MSYFNYQHLDELRADVERHGLDVPLEADTARIQEILGRPISVAGRVVGNSIAIHPMEGCDATPEGLPDKLMFRRYLRFARGGAKLIWFEATAVTPEGRANPRQLLINETSSAQLKELLDESRRAHREKFGRDDDLLDVLQLTHSGRYSYQGPLACFHHPLLEKRERPSRILTDGELEELEDRYARAALLAREIGFKGIDLKLTHGYFGNELLAARTRPGRYGGSFENRTKFARNVLQKIRQKTGDDLVLAVRLGVYDGVPFESDPLTRAGRPKSFPAPYPYSFGTDANDPLREDLAEPLALIEMLRKEGVSLLNISMGNPYTNPHLGRPFEKPDEGNYETPEHPLQGVARHFRLTAGIQERFSDLVVIGSGYSWLRHFQINAGAANIAQGRVTMMGVGRGALAYPNFAEDSLRHGTLDPRQVCKTYTYCTYLMRRKENEQGQFPTGCPPFDRDTYGPILKEARRAAGRDKSRKKV
jgi:NADPH2 dehydrogenase